MTNAQPLWRRVIAIAGAMALVLSAGLATLRAEPAPLAGLCPACFGFRQVADGLWSAGGTASDSAHLAEIVTAARARISAIYGAGATDATRILACVDDMCGRRLGGGSARAMTYGPALVTLRPGGMSLPVVSHELSHAALFRRIGWRATLSDAVPAWLNEGQAVLLAQDPQHRIDCPAKLPSLPVSARDWRRAAGKPGAGLYGLAACATQDWLDGHEGWPGFVAALDSVRAGEFDPFGLSAVKDGRRGAPQDR